MELYIRIKERRRTALNFFLLFQNFDYLHLQFDDNNNSLIGDVLLIASDQATKKVETKVLDYQLVNGLINHAQMRFQVFKKELSHYQVSFNQSIYINNIFITFFLLEIFFFLFFFPFFFLIYSCWECWNVCCCWKAPRSTIRKDWGDRHFRS